MVVNGEYVFPDLKCYRPFYVLANTTCVSISIHNGKEKLTLSTPCWCQFNTPGLPDVTEKKGRSEKLARSSESNFECNAGVSVSVCGWAILSMQHLMIRWFNYILHFFTIVILIRSQARDFYATLVSERSEDQSLYTQGWSMLWNSSHLLLDFDKLHFTELMFQGEDKAPVSPVTAKNMKVVLFFSGKVMFPRGLLLFFIRHSLLSYALLYIGNWKRYGYSK